MSTATEPKSWEITMPAPRQGARHDLRLGSDFFAEAAHADLLGGDVQAHVSLVPAGDQWRIALHVQGTVRTLCDRCQGPMDVEITDDYEAPMLPSPGGLVPAGDDTDAVYYDPATGRADLLRPLADTIALSFGLCHVHPDGQCDPAIEQALDHRDLEANTPLADALGALQGLDADNPEDPK